MISLKGKNALGIERETHNSILLSIKPKWFELIKSGKKTTEIRRRFCEVNCDDDLFFYVSSPVKKICGKVTGAVSATYWNREDIKLMLLENSCLSYDEMFNYLEGAREIHAIYFSQLDAIEELDLELKDFGLSRPPQNYCYLRKRIFCNADFIFEDYRGRDS